MYEILYYHITYVIGVKFHHETFKVKPILLLYTNFLNQFSFLFFCFLMENMQNMWEPCYLMTSNNPSKVECKFTLNICICGEGAMEYDMYERSVPCQIYNYLIYHLSMIEASLF